MDDLQPKILNPKTELSVGGRVRWGKNVTFGPSCRRVTIGFGAFIGNDLYLDVEELHVGDYFTIHHGSVVHGKQCSIGHNNWIGHYTILDSLGGLLQLGNNVGVGAHSQLWSHMKFGDRLAGCRWHDTGRLIVGDDVWFVGHCIVAPITAEARSMLMVGGVAVADMQANHVYAGSPAKDVTEKMGTQFEEITPDDRQKMFSHYLREYADAGNDVNFIKTVQGIDRADTRYTQYDLDTREYLPRYTDDEYRFMRFLLYEKAKFVPIAPLQGVLGER